MNECFFPSFKPIFELTKEEIRRLSPAKFRRRLVYLERQFRKSVLVSERFSRAIQCMEGSCRHIDSESRPNAMWCNDCKRYYNVDIS